MSLNAVEAPETPCSISAWAVQTFGASGSHLRVLARANEEMAETLRAATAEKPFSEIAEEAIDTLIVLCRYADRVGLTDLSFDSPQSPVEAPNHANVVAAAVFAHARLSDLLVDTLYSEPVRVLFPEVWGSLLEVVNVCGFRVQPLIDAKMAINRRREWKRDGTGHGYHVRDKTPRTNTP